MSQVRVELGIADHCWKETREGIAATIDALGDRFKAELPAGWLAYIRETYRMGPLRQLSQWERRLWCFVIESLMLLVCMLTDPQ